MSAHPWPTLLTRGEARARLLEAAEHYAEASGEDPEDLLQAALENITGLTVAILCDSPEAPGRTV